MSTKKTLSFGKFFRIKRTHLYNSKVNLWLSRPDWKNAEPKSKIKDKSWLSDEASVVKRIEDKPIIIQKVDEFEDEEDHG